MGPHFFGCLLVGAVAYWQKVGCGMSQGGRELVSLDWRVGVEDQFGKCRVKRQRAAIRPEPPLEKQADSVCNGSVSGRLFRSH